MNLVFCPKQAMTSAGLPYIPSRRYMVPQQEGATTREQPIPLRVAERGKAGPPRRTAPQAVLL
ncbi:hypothetical protein CTS44_08872 [Comamonas thiooxydans]|nr:hypothetical protein CTS44_08872 [Comamonas thiooxydans]